MFCLKPFSSSEKVRCSDEVLLGEFCRAFGGLLLFLTRGVQWHHGPARLALVPSVSLIPEALFQALVFPFPINGRLCIWKSKSPASVQQNKSAVLIVLPCSVNMDWLGSEPKMFRSQSII